MMQNRGNKKRQMMKGSESELNNGGKETKENDKEI